MVPYRRMTAAFNLLGGVFLGLCVLRMLCEGVVNLLRRNRTLQEPNRTFFDNFASRLSFIREKRGLGLAEVSGGAASTAKSWERGTMPRPALWDEIAARLRLSVSFVFLGKPVASADYDFLAKFADEIAGASEKIASRGVYPHATDADLAHVSDGAPLGYGGPNSIKAEIKRVLDDAMKAAGDDSIRLGWLLEQMRLHVVAPAKWRTGDARGTIASLQLDGETPEETLRRLNAEAAASGSGRQQPGGSRETKAS